MADNRTEQLEALEVMVEFNEKIIKNIHILVKELSGERLEDTDKFRESIINAINWEIQVLNGTSEVLNEEKQRVDKEAVNAKIIALSDALKEKEDAGIAKAFEDLLPELEILGNVAKEVINK